MTSQKTLAAVLALLIASAPGAAFAQRARGSSEGSSYALSQAVHDGSVGSLQSLRTSSGEFSGFVSGSAGSMVTTLRNLGLASSRGMSSAVRQSLQIRNSVSESSGLGSVAQASDQVGQFLIDSSRGAIRWSGNQVTISGKFVSNNSIARAVSEAGETVSGYSVQAVTSSGKLISGSINATSNAIAVNVLASGRVVDDVGRPVGRVMSAAGRRIRVSAVNTSQFMLNTAGWIYQSTGSQSAFQAIGQVVEELADGSSQVVTFSADQITSGARAIAESGVNASRWTAGSITLSAARSSAVGRAISGAGGETLNILAGSAYTLVTRGFYEASSEASGASKVVAVQFSQQTVNAFGEGVAPGQRDAGRGDTTSRTQNR